MFGEWTVIGTSLNKSYVLCQCSCGTIREVAKTNLKTGRSKSCGCQQHAHPASTLKQDLTGKTFGEWTVLYRNKNCHNQAMWQCRCSCGTERNVNGMSLKSGGTLSCGHTRIVDHSGERYGHWQVLEKSERRDKTGHIRTYYKCVCDCGTIRYVEASTLKSGGSQSCGCVNSKGQAAIISELQNFKIKFTTEFWFSDLRGNINPLRFDFEILDDKQKLLGLIEYQGKQHFKTSGNEHFGKYQREVSDSLKANYCKEHNILLFYIRYDEDIHLRMQEILSTLQVNPVPSSAGRRCNDYPEEEYICGETPHLEAPHPS